MSNLKIIYENFNLLIDQKMYGDGSLRYRYETGDFQNILAELIPYASISELPHLRLQPVDSWKDKIVWPKRDTPASEILMGLLDTMIVKVSAHTYHIQFVSRRAIFDFSLEKNGKKYNFWLIHENAPFGQDPTFSVLKRVQEIETGKLHSYPTGMSDNEILLDILSQI